MDNTNPQNPADPKGQQAGQTPAQQQPAQQQPAQQQPAQQQPAGHTPPPPTPPPSSSQPTGQTPAGGMPPFPGGMPPMPPPPVDNTPANFQLGTFFKEPIKIKLPPHPDTKFEDEQFVKLLAASISLSRLEKKKIIEAVPKLQQWQIDELISIFEEEKKKFAQLSAKHVPQLEKLAKQHYEEWRDIELEEVKQSKAEEDKSQADEIRKKLGL